MYMITLIGTGHAEHGNCNSNELYKFIEHIAPEVIFEEVPPGKFAGVYEGSRKDSLETGTIKRFLKKHTIAHVPVDLDTDEITDLRFKNDMRQTFHLFSSHSPEYNYLSNQHRLWSGQFGFPYLNSDQCGELLERKHFIEEIILQNINDEKLSQTYKDWLNLQDRRRDEMIKNINNYSDLNKYERALFLIGTEHRKPIMDKIPKFEIKNKRGLNWNFNYFK